MSAKHLRESIAQARYLIADGSPASRDKGLTILERIIRGLAPLNEVSTIATVPTEILIQAEVAVTSYTPEQRAYTSGPPEMCQEGFPAEVEAEIYGEDGYPMLCGLDVVDLDMHDDLVKACAD